MQSRLIILWQTGAIHIGPIDILAPHQLDTAILQFGVEKEYNIRLTQTEQTLNCRSALIPPQLKHTVNGQSSLMATIFLEVGTPLFSYLSDKEGHTIEGIKYDFEETDSWIDSLHKLYQTEYISEAALLTLFSDMFPSRLYSIRPNQQLDQRIKTVMSYIQTSAKDHLNIDELMHLSCLSEYRLRHLFKQTTGVSIGRYQIWQKIRRAVTGIEQGNNLTQAAVDAGFYDLAQMSKHFKGSMGISPSMIFPQNQGVRVININIDIAGAL